MGPIKICPYCNGEGQKWESGYQGFDGEMIECENCKGSGKLYIRTYELEIAFSDRNKKDFYDADSVIITQIRELQQKLKK
jgi:hypothetical protein